MKVMHDPDELATLPDGQILVDAKGELFRLSLDKRCYRCGPQPGANHRAWHVVELYGFGSEIEVDFAGERGSARGVGWPLATVVVVPDRAGEGAPDVGALARWLALAVTAGAPYDWPGLRAALHGVPPEYLWPVRHVLNQALGYLRAPATYREGGGDG